MTALSTAPREVVIEFEVDEADAERTYNAMEKLVHELGEIGTLSMRQRGDIDDLLRDSAELAAYKDRWDWLRSFIRASETSKESYERILRDAARWRMTERSKIFGAIEMPLKTRISQTTPGEPLDMMIVTRWLDAEIAREEGR